MCFSNTFCNFWESLVLFLIENLLVKSVNGLIQSCEVFESSSIMMKYLDFKNDQTSLLQSCFSGSWHRGPSCTSSSQLSPAAVATGCQIFIEL